MYGEPTAARIETIGDFPDPFLMDFIGHSEVANEVEAATMETLSRFY